MSFYKKYFLLSSAVFLICVFIITVTNYSFSSTFVMGDAGEQNDIFLLTSYQTSGKVFTGGDFKVDTFSDLNQKYGNIFSYFELPLDEGGNIVPLKSASRLFMKFPIFSTIGSLYFQSVWKCISMFLIFGSFYMFHKRLGGLNIFIGCILLIVFVPTTAFDLEFCSLPLSFLFLGKYLNSKKKIYLNIYFLYSFLAVFLRNEFFLFSSVIHGSLLLYWVYKKEYSNILYLSVFYTIFVSTILIQNYQYFGDFFTFGYQIERGGAGGLALEKNIFDKVIKIIFPAGNPDFFETVKNLGYVLFTPIGVGILMLFFLPGNVKLSSHKSFLCITIAIVCLYSFVLYGSNPYFYRPSYQGGYLNSSYYRYFSFGILTLWFFFYRGIGKSFKITPLLLVFCMLIYFISFDRYFGNIKLQTIYTYLESVKKPTIIWPLNNIQQKYTLTNYQVIFPLAKDFWDMVNFRDGLTSTAPEFLNKIKYFLQHSGSTLYIEHPTSFYSENNIYFSRIRGFFESDLCFFDTTPFTNISTLICPSLDKKVVVEQ